MLFTGMLTEILTRSGNTSGLHSCHSWHALPGHAASTGRHVCYSWHALLIHTGEHVGNSGNYNH